MHPGPYHCLASPNPKVVERTILGLHKHSEQFNIRQIRDERKQKS